MHSKKVYIAINQIFNSAYLWGVKEYISGKVHVKVGLNILVYLFVYFLQRKYIQLLLEFGN